MPGEEAVGANAADGAAFAAMPRLHRGAAGGGIAGHVRSCVAAAVPGAPASGPSAAASSRIGCRSVEPHAASVATGEGRDHRESHDACHKH